MNLKAIETEAEKERTLQRVRQLEQQPLSSESAYEREVLLKMVELYENRQLYENGIPSPLEAVHIRMQQRGLTQRDLEPFIGSRSKVSEVLSGKRPLSLDMIRGLHLNLGIPSDILLQAPVASSKQSLDAMDWGQFPLREMMKRGWIPEVVNFKAHAQELMAGLIVKAGGFDALPQGLYRKNDNKRKNAKSDPYALMAWGFRILGKAREEALPAKYVSGTITLDFLKQFAKLSFFEQGPLLAKECLAKCGIHLIIERHLPKTYLDGVAMKLQDGTPVIGMTLRYDRMDNFWFTLMHELTHVGRHLEEYDLFFDDHTLRKSGVDQGEDLESEADEWAEQALKPYAKDELSEWPTHQDVLRLAAKHQLHPDIIAGQIRYESGNYRLLPELRAEVRKYFELDEEVPAM